MTHYVGERVFGAVHPFTGDGAFAEFVVVGDDRVASSPDDLLHDCAAGLPVAGGIALQALMNVAHLTADQRVLINGAAWWRGASRGANRKARRCVCCWELQREQRRFRWRLGCR